MTHDWSTDPWDADGDDKATPTPEQRQPATRMEGDSTDYPITPQIALWAAVKIASGVSLTDEQADLAVRSIEANRWHLSLAEAAAPAALDERRLARVYMKVKGAHGPNAQVEDTGQPCEWCVLTAKQHLEAMAEYERLGREGGG